MFIKWFCKHEFNFVRNVYGDEIIHLGFRRSIWECSKCGKTKLSDSLHEKGVKNG